MSQNIILFWPILHHGNTLYHLYVNGILQSSAHTLVNCLITFSLNNKIANKIYIITIIKNYT